ncbi:unnamed protein product [Closterium sp. NIES-54]
MFKVLLLFRPELLGPYTNSSDTGGASSEGNGAERTCTGGASFFGVGAADSSTVGVRSGGAGVGSTDTGGTISDGAASRRAREEQEMLVQETLELQQQPKELQLEELAAGAAIAAPTYTFAAAFPTYEWSLDPWSPSSSSDHSPPPPAHGLPPPDSSTTVVSHPCSQLIPPVVPHSWVTLCPPRARPFHLLLSYPSLSPTIIELLVLYVTHVLASLVTNPRASPASVSALDAAVGDFAATRHLDYTTSVVAACPLSLTDESAFDCDVLEKRQFELELLAAASPHLCAMLLALEGDPDAFNVLTPRTYRVLV